METVQSLCQRKAPRFLPYLNVRIFPLLRDHITSVWKSSCAQPNWTNNNAESGNNQLKLAVDWKKKSLPDLIQKLHQTVESQYQDLKRAIVGRGIFQLSEPYREFQHTHQAWCALTQDRKEKNNTKGMYMYVCCRKTWWYCVRRKLCFA